MTHISPKDYDSWRCHECKGDCMPEWQHCDCVTNEEGLTVKDPDPDCDSCGGSGGGHICLNDEGL